MRRDCLHPRVLEKINDPGIFPAAGSFGMFVKKVAVASQLEFVKSQNEMKVTNSLIPHGLGPGRIHLFVVNVLVQASECTTRW